LRINPVEYTLNGVGISCRTRRLKIGTACSTAKKNNAARTITQVELGSDNTITT
jgi:hypothetical protein